MIKDGLAGAITESTSIRFGHFVSWRCGVAALIVPLRLASCRARIGCRCQVEWLITLFHEHQANKKGDEYRHPNGKLVRFGPEQPNKPPSKQPAKTFADFSTSDV
jgi:hypothetical protein